MLHTQLNVAVMTPARCDEYRARGSVIPELYEGRLQDIGRSLDNNSNIINIFLK